MKVKRGFFILQALSRLGPVSVSGTSLVTRWYEQFVLKQPVMSGPARTSADCSREHVTGGLYRASCEESRDQLLPVDEVAQPSFPKELDRDCLSQEDEGNPRAVAVCVMKVDRPERSNYQDLIRPEQVSARIIRMRIGDVRMECRTRKRLALED
jgi:hypothetical protein